MKTRSVPVAESPAPPPEGVAALFTTGGESSQGTDLDWDSDASLQAACARAEAQALESRVGTSIGPYRLTALLGRGGMGAVFAAERSDGAFEQRVALKLVQGGAHGPQLEARFRRERAILARLEHANIARLIDGGLSDAGELWFAMERVEGESLAGYCDRHGLGLEARLRLFLEICDAVAFAHANLVVHRDLKPPNVMVTDEGRAKLLDFGIAKLVGPGDERDELTRNDERVLTPDYAAPEQVLGQPITTATDVYALGLLLYEMLTGDRAQRLGSLSALDAARVIAERDPPRASAAAVPFARALAGDLDAIVAKALRKEPGRRYVGAQALGDDVRRYLSGHPVAARTDTWSYRAGKFARRHRLGLAASAAVLVALLAGLAAALWQAREAQLQAQRAESVKEFVTDMFNTVDPRTGRRGGREITAHALLDGGVERLRSRLGAQPADRAELLLALSALYWGLGDSENASARSREALAIHRALYPKGDVRVLPSLARVVQGVGATEQPEGLALMDEADALLERAGPAYDDERLAILQQHLIRANRAGDFQASESAAQSMLALQERRYGPGAPEVGVGFAALGWAYAWQNRYDEAERMYRRALALEPPDQRGTVFDVSSEQIRFQLGNLALYQGRYAEAEREFLAAKARTAERYGPDHFYMRMIRQSIAYNAFNLGRVEEAETELRALHALELKLLPESQRFPNWMLGRVLAGRGKLEGALAQLRGSLEQTRKTNGAQAKLTQFIARDLGAALVETGALDEAGTVLEGAMAELERIETSASYQYALVESRYARLQLARGDAAGAEVRARHAWSVLRERIGDDYDETARAAHELGRARVALGHADGIALLRGAAQNYEQHFGRADVRTAAFRFVLGEALLASAPNEARPMLDESARALVAADGNTLPVRTRAERWLAAPTRS